MIIKLDNSCFNYIPYFIYHYFFLKMSDFFGPELFNSFSYYNIKVLNQVVTLSLKETILQLIRPFRAIIF
jgi:hypothetical protein